ncbi:MAG: hypothetical protein WC191_10595 [Proteiniphilum sp.]|jgi:hypothetical protein|nr:hypothetical protein [Proteiniphilum sp.]MDD3556883.1 hypothetical protein [Proteiniphilum sp.]MDD3980534.1 hypothetical protein [Proteiniphilum sp.]MDD5620583.1 hypothetical protein [Proteiniphilum sp.]MDY0183092.1 hypothetical protein [Proteiniphilum sp.]
MGINELRKRKGIGENKQLIDAYIQFEKLLTQLRKRKLPDEVVQAINTNIDLIDPDPGTEEDLRKQLRKTQSDILRLIEKELKLVPKNHYRNVWLALGIAAFGVPLGVVFGASLGNMGYLAIGIPFGLSIGLAIGTGLDKKAADEGRQLDVEINF